MARIMSIDYGDVRIGIALTDPLQIISSGYKTIQNTNTSIQEIFQICKEKQVESVVIGIPFDSDSKIGKSASKVLTFSEKLINYFLKNNLELPFYEQDERYTTCSAIYSMREINVKKKNKKKVVDQIAAANILIEFMQSKQKIKLDISKYLNSQVKND
jgi:putative holliday junction resolvase